MFLFYICRNFCLQHINIQVNNSNLQLEHENVRGMGKSGLKVLILIVFPFHLHQLGEDSHLILGPGNCGNMVHRKLLSLFLRIIQRRSPWSL